jgi:hypothetical protein
MLLKCASKAPKNNNSRTQDDLEPRILANFSQYPKSNTINSLLQSLFGMIVFCAHLLRSTVFGEELAFNNNMGPGQIIQESIEKCAGVTF